MDVFDETFKVNLRAYVELSHLAVPYLDETNGTIISTSSMLSMRPHTFLMAYGASKAGVDFMTKVLALELGPKIRVNAVNPGHTRSNLNHIMGAQAQQALESHIIELTPLKRVADPLDVAKGVVFLASDDASFITGANLVIDGG
ncbi:unnamed protein product, partial [Oppiella nova]